MASLGGLPYAHDLYTRMLDHVLVDNEPLGTRVLASGHNAWECASQLAFMVDLGNWAKYGTMPDKPRLTLKSFCVQGALAVWTLVSVLVSMRKSKVLVFSVDKTSAHPHIDFRLSELYRVLHSQKVSYLELFHTDVRLQSLRTALTRGRPALYLEGIDWLYCVCSVGKRRVRHTVTGLETFSKEEARVLKIIVEKYVDAEGLFDFRTAFLTWAIKAASIRTIVGIDDARYYHAISVAAQKLALPFIAFQHAHITPYNIAWLHDSRLKGHRARPSTLAVWNEFWKHEFRALHSVWEEAELVVAGSPKDEKTLSVARGDAHTPVVIPFETEAPREKVSALVEALHKSGIRILFKLRPDKTPAFQLGTLGDARTLVEPVSKIREPVRAVIGTYSSYLYDAIAAGIPVGLLVSELRYAERLGASGMVVSVDLAHLEEHLAALDARTMDQCHAFAERVAPVKNLDSFLATILTNVA